MRTTCVTFSFVFLLLAPSATLAQREAALSEMPRVDVHSHIGSLDLMEDYLAMTRVLKESDQVNLEVFVDLLDYREGGAALRPGMKGIEFLEEVEARFEGRFLLALSDYRIADGLQFPPEELAEWQKRGIVGYKIWVGVSDLIDDPANDPTFTKMEQLGLPGAGVHISQPYPTRWCDDPVKFWQAQNAWERVLDRHPRLKVVQAHMLDHFNSDEQLDYLSYVLETYPNVNLDLAARFQQFHRMDPEKLRNFFIRYADRILFGTDISQQPRNEGAEAAAERYRRCFGLLETDDTVDAGFFGGEPAVGLALPLEVLEKIYYRNAARVFPRVGETLAKLGYEVAGHGEAATHGD
jgi:predicted TIM-barrel fold metal-dependent hydrolase